jgi:hypothetical protein
MCKALQSPQANTVSGLIIVIILKGFVKSYSQTYHQWLPTPSKVTRTIKNVIVVFCASILSRVRCGMADKIVA